GDVQVKVTIRDRSGFVRMGSLGLVLVGVLGRSLQQHNAPTYLYRLQVKGSQYLGSGGVLGLGVWGCIQQCLDRDISTKGDVMSVCPVNEP
ncbi:hypothetical protein G9A89_000215, partial [Geosiphon pyriformis]